MGSLQRGEESLSTEKAKNKLVQGPRKFSRKKRRGGKVFLFPMKKKGVACGGKGEQIRKGSLQKERGITVISK